MLRPVHTLPLVAVAVGLPLLLLLARVGPGTLPARWRNKAPGISPAVAPRIEVIHMAPLVIVAGPTRERRASADLR